MTSSSGSSSPAPGASIAGGWTGRPSSTPGVIARSRDQFVPLKLRSDEHEALAQTLGLTSLPSTVIVRPNGEVVDKYEGYIEPETFDVTLLDVLRREGRSPEQIAARKKRPRTARSPWPAIARSNSSRNRSSSRADPS